MTHTSRLIALHRAAQTKPGTIRDRLAARGLVLRTFDLAPDVRARLDQVAAATGRPVGDIVDTAIQEWTAEVLEDAGPARTH
ncbi:hypothetical protein ACGFYZ_40075 [Streptomyces sp. NPDC048330]|uniref:hypothetical protein n=1 Tax=Streptomyces sp. NPDC048330 TaxID=3365533 RepID=UPI003711B24A